MRILLGLTLITLALFSWQAAGNVAAQVLATPTAVPIATATPDKEQLEIAKVKAETDRLTSWVDRYVVPVLPGLLTGGLAIFAAYLATRPVWRRMKIESDRLQQDRNRYEADREADAQRRDEEQFRFIVEQFSKDAAAKLSAAVVIQTFFREERLARFRRQAVEILIGNLRVWQTEPMRKSLMVALKEGIFSLPPEGQRLDLRGCNLKGAEWGPKGEGGNAVGIPLAGALLSGADTHLENALLGEADLLGAWLVRANLQRADFEGAELDDRCIASLAGTNWRDAHWDDDVRQMLEERYGVPEGGHEPEAAAETPGEHEP